MSLNPLDRIESYYDEFTKTDRDIAVWIINHPRLAFQLASDDVAKSAGTSKAALIRFAKKIGYSGYAEFKFELSRSLASNNVPANIDEPDASPTAAISKVYADYILAIQNSVEDETVNHIADLFLKAKRVKILGRNRTFNSALQLRQRLGRLGYDAEAIGESILMSDACSILTPDDLVLIYTTSNNLHFYDEIVKILQENGCPFACITMSQTISWRKACAAYIVLPRISKETSMTFLDDQPVMMVFNEILIHAIAARGSQQAS